ncbi:hypothetical protein TNCV_2487321 [Trichonephila clavipes]|uniref:Uncharacterized protein n=1 Tax=Trichonephila clavipes TaxID=2585209 RepID=A0A8X6VZS4_TRICX|nr:hypothetical protein TNCV_2487321 [Trichonephila clavipes]
MYVSSPIAILEVVRWPTSQQFKDFFTDSDMILFFGCSDYAKSNGKLSHGSLLVKVSDRGWLVTSSSPVPLNTRLVGELYYLNLLKRPPVEVVWLLGEGMPAQVLSSSHDLGS